MILEAVQNLEDAVAVVTVKVTTKKISGRSISVRHAVEEKVERTVHVCAEYDGELYRRIFAVFDELLTELFSFPCRDAVVNRRPAKILHFLLNDFDYSPKRLNREVLI